MFFIQRLPLGYIFAFFALSFALLVATWHGQHESTEGIIGTVVYARPISVYKGDLFSAAVDGLHQLVLLHIDNVDAPELDQPFGVQSVEFLSEILGVGSVGGGSSSKQQQPRRLICAIKERDARGFYAANVAYSIPGDDTGGTRFVYFDRALVHHGWAWARKGTPANSSLLKLQAEAKAHKRGLWVDPNATPPWVFRRRRV